MNLSGGKRHNWKLRSVSPVFYYKSGLKDSLRGKNSCRNTVAGAKALTLISVDARYLPRLGPICNNLFTRLWDSAMALIVADSILSSCSDCLYRALNVDGAPPNGVG
jgi:hypothetical protein